jgi:hypothetical protein
MPSELKDIGLLFDAVGQLWELLEREVDGRN